MLHCIDIYVQWESFHMKYIAMLQTTKPCYINLHRSWLRTPIIPLLCFNSKFILGQTIVQFFPVNVINVIIVVIAIGNTPLLGDGVDSLTTDCLLNSPPDGVLVNLSGVLLFLATTESAVPADLNISTYDIYQEYNSLLISNSWSHRDKQTIPYSLMFNQISINIMCENQ